MKEFNNTLSAYYSWPEIEACMNEMVKQINKLEKKIKKLEDDIKWLKERPRGGNSYTV